MKIKLNYITHDSWWNSDLPMFSRLHEKFAITAFSFSSRHHTKNYPTKQSPYLVNIFEYERKYRLKNILSLASALRFYTGIRSKSKKDDTYLYVYGDDFYFNSLLLLFFKKRKIIISVHNFNDHSDSPFYDRFFKRIFFRHFQNFHFHSETQYDKFRLAYPRKNSFYTNMPSKDFGTPSGQVRIEKKGKRSFLFFGHIRDYKRLDLFIEAANASDKGAHFVIAGNCSNWSEFETLIRNKEQFTLDVHFIDNSAIPDYFAQADFLVLPYSDTTQSGPLHIAYNYNLPVIVSDLEGFTNFIHHGVNGFVFQSGKVSDLVNCITAAMSMNDEEYLKMRENLKRSANEYNEKTSLIGRTFDEFIAANMA